MVTSSLLLFVIRIFQMAHIYTSHWWEKNTQPFSKQETLAQCWFDVGTPSATLAKHQIDIGPESCAHWVLCISNLHETLAQCWFDVGPPSATLDQHQINSILAGIGILYQRYCAYNTTTITSRPHGYNTCVILHVNWSFGSNFRPLLITGNLWTGILAHFSKPVLWHA